MRYHIIRYCLCMLSLTDIVDYGISTDPGRVHSNYGRLTRIIDNVGKYQIPVVRIGTCILRPHLQILCTNHVFICLLIAGNLIGEGVEAQVNICRVKWSTITFNDMQLKGRACGSVFCRCNLRWVKYKTLIGLVKALSYGRRG